MFPVIRAIQDENELKSFLHVIVESFSTVAEEFSITRETAPTNPAFITLERLTDLFKKIACFGLYSGDIPAGFFGLEESRNSLLMIEKISVLPEFRHKGYGKMILDYSVNFAVAKKFKRISIAIINENRRLKNWYTGYGFAEVNTTVFPHLPFEVCFMEYNISSCDN